jgi:alanine dehydrogenase
LDVVGEKEVRRLISSETALSIARDTLVDQSGGYSRLSIPSAMSLDAESLGGPRFKFKAATVGHFKVSGIRLLARFKGQTGDDACNHVAIYDHEEGGALVGLVSELWLSRIRTAAFGVAAVEAFVANCPLVIGLFGAGDIADEIVPILALAFSNKNLKVLSRRRDRTTEFVERHSALLGSRIAVARTPEHVVSGSDLVVTLTESRDPLVQPGWLGPGAVLCSMGSHNEVAFDVLAEAERLVVDDPEYASEIGDGGAWIRAGHITHEAFNAQIDGLACDYAAAFRRGIRSDGRRTIALIQGMAIGDVALASHVLRAWKASA